MKTLTLALLALCASLTLSAQVLTTPLVQTFDPTGNCTVQTAQLVINTTTPTLWICNSTTGAYSGGVAGSNTGTGANVLATSPTITTPTLKLPVIADTTTASKTAQFSLSGATASTATTLTFAQTTARTVTFPDASITVSGATVNNCGTANACSATNVSASAKVVVGVTAALNGASPAIATVTGMPAFTSSSSYVCTANPNSASASTHILAINYVSSSSVTFTGANGATDTVSYMCFGS